MRMSVMNIERDQGGIETNVGKEFFGMRVFEASLVCSCDGRAKG
jgi:hypothetical protein